MRQENLNGKNTDFFAESNKMQAVLMRRYFDGRKIDNEAAGKWIGKYAEKFRRMVEENPAILKDWTENKKGVIEIAGKELYGNDN